MEKLRFILGLPFASFSFQRQALKGLDPPFPFVFLCFSRDENLKLNSWAAFYLSHFTFPFEARFTRLV